MRRRRGAKRVAGSKLNKRQVRQVKKIVNIGRETKYINFVQPGTAISNVPLAPQLICVIPQGLTDSQRDGDRIMLKPRLYMTYNAVVGDATNYVRFLVFQWKPLNNPVPTAADVLLTGSSGSIDFTSQYHHDARQLYKIMYDKVHRLAGNGSAATTPSTSITTIFQKVILKIPAKQQQYDSAGVNHTNALYLVTVSDSAVIPHPQYSATVKTLFTDS